MLTSEDAKAARMTVEQSLTLKVKSPFRIAPGAADGCFDKENRVPRRTIPKRTKKER
jgi:hypothetical protein